MRLRIEKDNRGSENKTGGNSMVAKAHVVEDGPKNKKRGSTHGKALGKETHRKTKGSRANALTATSMVIEQRTLKEDVYYLSTTEPRGVTVYGKLINFQG
ncbi:unnamed protein product [Prunus armeniaca]